MKDCKDKVAVVTGAASGSGLALAERCAQEGMHSVLADIEEYALRQAEQRIQRWGAKTLMVVTDVSDGPQMEALARKTMDNFGAVHLLFNNAGVSIRRYIREATESDWQWVLGVNLWGVIHGLRVFLPLMLSQKTAAHIVNTASLAGLISGISAVAPYSVSKHGVVALSESLYHELRETEALVGVSVFCPGAVQTRILDAERNRPPTAKTKSLESGHQQKADFARERIAQGITPQAAAAMVFNGIQQEMFYILTDPKGKLAIHLRLDDILQERRPTGIEGARPRVLRLLLRSLLPLPRLGFLWVQGARKDVQLSK